MNIQLIVYCLTSVVASTVAHSALSVFWAKRRAPLLYIASTTILWLAVSTLPFTYRAWESARFPADRKHFMALLFWSAPFAIVPALPLSVMASRGASPTRLTVVGFVTSLIALLISIYTGLEALCSLGDCL